MSENASRQAVIDGLLREKKRHHKQQEKKERKNNRITEYVRAVVAD